MRRASGAACLPLLVFAPVLALTLGCVASTPRPLTPSTEARVLPGVPVREFGPQTCGPATLAAVLEHHGEQVTVAELERVLPKGRNDGVLTLDMLIEARRRGYDARLVEGTPEAVEAELLAGRPVILMLQVYDFVGEERDLFHYVILDGIDPAAGLVRVQWGDREPRWTTLEHLDKTWQPTKRATLLIAPGDGEERRADLDILRYAVALEAAGRGEEAIALYRRLLASDEASPVVWTNLGNAEAGRGDPAAAETAYRRALELAPESRDTLNNLAWLLLEEGERLEEAEQLARRAVAALGPDPYLALDTLGRVLRERGSCDEALAVFAEAAAAAPGGADAVRERLGLEAGLTRRRCGDPAWREEVERLAATARDPGVVEEARAVLGGG